MKNERTAAPAGAVQKAVHSVESSNEVGLRLNLVEKFTDVAEVNGKTPVLCVHGATLAGYIWDIPVPRMSFLDHFAKAGHRSFALDIRGYAGSACKAALDAADAPDKPYGRAQEAILDIDDAIDFIREETGFDTIYLVGSSWGTVTTALYCTGPGAEKVDRLVLAAPLFAARNEAWLKMIQDPENHDRPNPALGPYRLVSRKEVEERWDAEIPGPDKTIWRSPTVFDALMKDAVASGFPETDPSKQIFCAPNGTLIDLFEVFSARPLYDPSLLSMPVLLIRGDADPTSTHSDASNLFERIGSPIKRYMVIGNGAHFLVAEVNNWQMFDEIECFFNFQ